MSKAGVKRALAGLLLVVAGAATFLTTGRLGRVIEQAETGADPAGALTEVVVPVDPDEIEWLEDAPLPRRMEAATRRAVGEAYLLSLALLEGSLTVAQDDDLAVHLTGPALDAALRADRGGRVVVRRHHRLRALFYSADGQLVELHDEATRVVALGDGPAVLHTEQAVAVLVQIDGVWHLRHRVVEQASTDTIADRNAAAGFETQRKETK